MHGLNAALSTIGVLAGLLVVAATVVAFFRANYAKATIETLRDSNEALGKRVGELEAENGRQATKILHLEQESEVLRSIVSGADAIARMERQHAERHQELTDRLAAITETLRAKGSAA